MNSVSQSDSHQNCRDMSEKLNNKIVNVINDTEEKYKEMDKVQMSNDAIHSKHSDTIDQIGEKLDKLMELVSHLKPGESEEACHTQGPSSTGNHEQETEKTSKVTIIVGREKRDRNNIFQCYYAKVNNMDEVNESLQKIKSSQTITPDHNIFAFRTESSGDGMHHDGEYGADIKLANLLKENNCQNCIVVVSRKVNGVHIRGDRFRNVMQVAKGTLIDQGLIQNDTMQESSRPNQQRNQVKRVDDTRSTL